MAGTSSACDIWSLGCTVIELLVGSPPYFELPPLSALFRIVQDESPPLPDGISPALRDFLSQCFRKEPSFRATALDLLKHPWLSANLEAAGSAKRGSGGRALSNDSALESFAEEEGEESDGFSSSGAEEEPRGVAAPSPAATPPATPEGGPAIRRRSSRAIRGARAAIRSGVPESEEDWEATREATIVSTIRLFANEREAI
ncbi:hypothetical protein EON68_01550, partial [archaeon]